MSMLCHLCRAEITRDSRVTGCRRCGCPLPERQIGEAQCPDCARTKFRFQTVVPLGIHRNGLREAIIRIKNFHEYPLARSVGFLLGEKVRGSLDVAPDVIVPIPKFWIKRLFRGSNSAESLAHEVGKFLRVPDYHGALRWKRQIEKQSLLSVTERLSNVRGALDLRTEYDFRDAHVLLIDDTMTSGATANEAARVLLQSGASRVSVAVAARAMSRHVMVPPLPPIDTKE
jgi:ComF family protein